MTTWNSNSYVCPKGDSAHGDQKEALCYLGCALALLTPRQMSRPYRGISPNPEPSAQWHLIAIAVISQRPGEEMPPAPGTQLRNGKAEHLYSHCLYLTDNSVSPKKPDAQVPRKWLLREDEGPSTESFESKFFFLWETEERGLSARTEQPPSGPKSQTETCKHETSP